MATLSPIKEQQRVRTLQRLASLPRRKKIMHLDDIHSIGIVARALNDEDLKTLNQFTRHMTNRGIKVTTIEMPADTATVLDHNGLPTMEFIAFFIKESYDLLVNITTADDPFGLYVTLKSRALLRVAYDDTTQLPSPLAEQCYDLFLRGRGPRVLAEYLTQLLTYLTQIRK